uniref:Uncharacterized protein n=1 Tax=Caudovirales sp. ct1Jx6 TaxID=2826765 RepID=A0A8S5MM21_9CAUD|nr:MAG TPA: hypothetical protein [Caudovirales sp. ct1Jx6]
MGSLGYYSGQVPICDRKRLHIQWSLLPHGSNEQMR